MQILQLELATHHLRQQHGFYRDVLGLPVVEDTANRIVFQVGTSLLSFVQASEPMAGSYHFAFNIPENQFAQGKAWLQQRVALLTNSAGADEYAFESWNAHAVYFLDPAGNIAELIARHALPNASSAPFSAQSLLSVSEIGIAASDVLAHVSVITTRGGLPVYAGPASPAFTAIGDEHGLFIVVPEHRIWHPETGRAAVQLPITVATSIADHSLTWKFPLEED